MLIAPRAKLMQVEPNPPVRPDGLGIFPEVFRVEVRELAGVDYFKITQKKEDNYNVLLEQSLHFQKSPQQKKMLTFDHN